MIILDVSITGLSPQIEIVNTAPQITVATLVDFVQTSRYADIFNSMTKDYEYDGSLKVTAFYGSPVKSHLKVGNYYDINSINYFISILTMFMCILTKTIYEVHTKDNHGTYLSYTSETIDMFLTLSENHKELIEENVEFYADILPIAYNKSIDNIIINKLFNKPRSTEWRARVNDTFGYLNIDYIFEKTIDTILFDDIKQFLKEQNFTSFQKSNFILQLSRLVVDKVKVTNGSLIYLINFMQNRNALIELLLSKITIITEGDCYFIGYLLHNKIRPKQLDNIITNTLLNFYDVEHPTVINQLLNNLKPYYNKEQQELLKQINTINSLQ